MEKTIEELQRELLELKEQRINDLLAMGDRSKVVENQNIKNQTFVVNRRSNDMQQFKADYVQKNKVSGMSYYDLIREIVDGRGKEAVLRDIRKKYEE